MAYINYEDWAVGDLCSKSGSDGDLDLREEFLIVALFSLEWLVFVGILGVLTFQIILQTIWESEEEEQEVADIASVLLKPPPLNEEQQNEYAKDDGFEFDFSEDFFEDLDLKEYLNEEESKEEDDDDSGNSSVCSTVGRFLCDEVKYKLSYYFHHLGILKSQSLVTNEPTAYECETSDESFEGIADEEKWGEDESGNLEGESYEDAEFAEWYFPEECSCKA